MRDAASFQKTYGDEMPWVWNALRRLGVPEKDLADTVHDVFMVAWQKRDTFEAGRAVKPWLFGIATRLAANLRTRRASAESPSEHVDINATHENPAQLLEAKQVYRQVLHSLAALDDEKRQVFVGHDIEAIPMPELAAALGVPLNTAYSRLRVARVQFENAFQSGEKIR